MEPTNSPQPPQQPNQEPNIAPPVPPVQTPASQPQAPAESPVAAPTQMFQSQTITPLTIASMPVNNPQPVTPQTIPTPTSSFPSPVNTPASTPAQPFSFGPPTPPVVASGLENSTDLNGATIGNGYSGAEAPSPSNRKGLKLKKPGKKLLLFVGLPILLLLAASTYVFAWYLPNTPENVWKTGMTRTASELEGFVNKIADPATSEALSKQKITVSGEYKADGVEVIGEATSVADKTKSDTSLELSTSGENAPSTIDINAQIKTQTVEGSLAPNLYFNISGLATLGLDAYLPNISQYDGRWIAVEQDFYNQYLGQTGVESGETEKSELTYEESIAITREILAVTNEYVFTDDEAKSIFIVQSFEGREDSEGIKANRYKVQLNTANTILYCNALVDVYATSFKDKVGEGQAEVFEGLIGGSKETCDKLKDESASKENFDIWIDTKYKLLHKIRITNDLDKKNATLEERQQKCENELTNIDGGASYCEYLEYIPETGESYVEFGQIYTGDDTVKLFAQNKDDTNVTKSLTRFDLALNFKTFAMNGTVNFKDESSESPSNGTINLKTEPHTSEIDADKPEDVIPIMDIMNEMMNASANSYQLGASTDETSEQAANSAFLNLLKTIFSSSETEVAPY